MGVKIFDIVSKKSIEFKDLKDKVLIFDASLTIYQFLSSIRQADGSLLTDSKGNVTSHLIGLLSRITNFMQKGIKPVFVFDGKPPELKIKEQKRRKELKEKANQNFEIAKQEKDLEAMKKYASRTSHINKEIIDESKKLLSYFGIPIVQAPCEADAQIAYMARQDGIYAAATQDADVLMFGAPTIVRNLSVSQRKKSNLKYHKTNIELIKLSDVLNELGIDLNQLIVIGIMVGTDYNIGGIKGIGSKKALKLIKKYNYDFDNLFKDLKWSDYFDYPWDDVYNTIRNMETTGDYDLNFGEIQSDRIIELLCKEHDFSLDMVNSRINKLIEQKEKNKPKSASLNKWF